VNATASPLLTPDICEILRAEAFVAFKSLPRRGAELGGFLTKSASSAEEFFADGAEFVACEHLFGPSYHLSPSDLEFFRRQAETSEYPPVGYFRSCTRPEMRLEPEDLEVLRTAVPGGNFIVLLKPYPNGNSDVRIFAGENLDLVSEFEVRMNLEAMPEPVEEPEPRRMGPEPSPLISLAKASPSETVRDEMAPAASKLNSRWLAYLAVAALIAIAVGVALVATSRQQPPQASGAATSSALGMRVERQTDNFRVTWNRNLPALRNATGTLTIDDGHQPRDLQLDATQIASGSVVYVSDAGDLTFRMRVRRDSGQQATESVRVVIGGRPPQPVAGVVGPAQVPERKEARVVPAIRAWASAVPRIATYRPAIPVRRIKPEIPSSLVRNNTVVEVMVRVDAWGRVSEAHAVGQGATVPESLSTQVIDASKQWTFQPAKVHGRGVASDYTIVYSFTSSGL
jgi:hypothetical protein